MVMAFRSNSNSESAKVEQLVTELFLKSTQIILESRAINSSSRNFGSDQITLSSPSSSSTASPCFRPRDKCLNLVLRDSTAAAECFDHWKHSNKQLLVIDVILIQRNSGESLGEQGLSRSSSGKEEVLSCWSPGVNECFTEKIVERWVVQFDEKEVSNKDSGTNCLGGRVESKKIGVNCRGGRARGCNDSGVALQKGFIVSSNSLSALPSFKKAYKSSNIVFRSLYVTVKLLPVYKIFRFLSSSRHVHRISLSYKVLPFAEPFSREEEAEMKLFVFAPIDTIGGTFCLSVWYRPSLDDVKFEQSTTESSPRLIMDYVGSPTVDPLKRFFSGSYTPRGQRGTYVGSHPSSCVSSPSSPNGRRHSWSDINRVISSSCSNSPPCVKNALQGQGLPPRHPLHDDQSPPIKSQLPRLVIPSRGGGAPPHVHKKGNSLDEYWPSPPFSPSPSPSPPQRQSLTRVLLRCESDPLSVPTGRGPGLPLPNCHIRVCNLLPSPSPKKGSTQCASQGDGEYNRHKEFLLGREDFVSLIGRKLSSDSSSRVSMSRSSTKFSFQDESDDCESVCPFAVADGFVDVHQRRETIEGKRPIVDSSENDNKLTAKKSQNAAVGVLVEMLQNAAPLHPHHPTSSANIHTYNKEESEVSDEHGGASNPAVDTSGPPSFKTIADALKELKSYTEMKLSLLSTRKLKLLNLQGEENVHTGSS